MAKQVAKVFSVAPIGVDGHIIEVESDTSKGLPTVQIVGLGNKAIEEAKERVRSAIANSLLEYPSQRITINLAPAELPKDGTHYDLPIALAILVSSGQLQQGELEKSIFAGELALDGSLRPIRGAITLAETAKAAGLTSVYLPKQNADQASLVNGIEIIPIASLKALFLHLKGELILPSHTRTSTATETPPPSSVTLDDIYGQEQAKRALTIAAAGHHNILLTGPPGAGKTMLAKALLGLLSPLSDEERVAVTKIHSLAGEAIETSVMARPFRTPHHTASRTSLIGGGTKPKPGDISLAHLGVLFLDEIPEYPRSILESIRQPLEDKKIIVSRANGHASYPADFMLVATMNPCPCGFFGDNTKECSCSSSQIIAYQKRLSGPLLDRIDMIINVSRVPNDILLNTVSMHYKHQESAILSINTAINMQINRYGNSIKNNSNISTHELKTHFHLSPDVRQLLTTAADRLQLSARSYFKILKVARTIADLEGADNITATHVGEALQYRQKA